MSKEIIDTRSEIEKLYDHAYQQGFKHCKDMFKLLVTKMVVSDVSAELDKFIDEKFPAHMKQQTTSDPKIAIL